MSVTVTKSLATDFGGYLDQTRLPAEISTGAGLSEVHFRGVTIDSDVVSLAFDQTLTGDEQTALSAVIAAHGTLANAQAFRVAEIDLEINAFIAGRYPTHRQVILTYMRGRAADDGLTNRRDYIDALWAWIDSLIGYFFTKRDAVLAAATPAEVDAVTLDFSSYEASDPAVTIEAARAIED